MTRVPVRRALVSVSDKTGLADLCRSLHQAGVEIVSSGGTAAALADAGVPVVLASSVTGSPEILGGRVKTLHPRIHGGILADHDDPAHREDLQREGIAPFELVVVNLYPFRATAARQGASPAEVVEHIDIGGPAMIRAAAKNHRWVGVVTSPADYEEVAREVAAGGLDGRLRQRLAQRAFFHTSSYDAAIVAWMGQDETLPEHLVLALERAVGLRYGENPHQPGALYRVEGEQGWWGEATFVQGKAMSFNNYADADAAWRMVSAFPDPGAVVVKHTNACGVAVRPDLAAALSAAWECDPLSAFGGVVALNRTLDLPTAQALAEVFVEVVVAPAVNQEAGAVLAGKENLRLLAAPAPVGQGLDLRRIDGGLLAQPRDAVEGSRAGWKVVSSREPTAAEWDDLEFAWTVAAHTKSNAIVVARGRAAVGIGAGDQSRVGASERAVRGAGERAQGAVAASEALLPFRDGLDTLAAAGVTALVEPGGSRRDDEVIAAAEEHGMGLVFTGRRHFLH